MSIQDKLERILKEIHIVLAEGQSIPGEEDLIVVDKKDVLGILEKLNLTVYEMMEQYEVTSQARELAERRTEKKGEELVAKIEQQTEDIYAASLMYTEDAMNRVSHLISNALSSSKRIFQDLQAEIEKEQLKVKEDQLDLREQLQDFKDAKKYIMLLEECNKEREKELQDKEGMAVEKRIQNEAKHYAMSEKPEIKVNPAYFQRRGLLQDSQTLAGRTDSATGRLPELEEKNIPAIAQRTTVHELPPMPVNVAAEPEEKDFVMPEIKVDLDAEYFKWQAEEAEKSGDRGVRSKETAPKRKFLFGKSNRRENE